MFIGMLLFSLMINITFYRMGFGSRIIRKGVTALLFGNWHMCDDDTYNGAVFGDCR